ncbi:hypothetical protein ACVIJ6_000615 [Bradyrhizobium sp. USDA 4369]
MMDRAPLIVGIGIGGERHAGSTVEKAALAEAVRFAAVTQLSPGRSLDLIPYDDVENLRVDRRVHLAGGAVGATLATVRNIALGLRGWLTPFSAVINASTRPFSQDGRCDDPVLAQQIALRCRAGHGVRADATAL